MEEQTCRHHGAKILGIIVLGIVMVVAILQQAFLPSSKTITAVGQSRIQVNPDIAVLGLSIITLKAPDTKTALEQTTQKIQKVQEALEQLGVAKEDQQITGYAFNPVYDVAQSVEEGDQQIPASEKIVGYNGLQEVTVKIRGINEDRQKIDRLIESVINAGASQVGDVYFIYSDIEKVKQEARLKAIQDAKSKAGAMAQVAGVKLKDISSWTENVLTAPGQAYYEGNYSGYNSSSITFNNENNPVSVGSNNQTDLIMEVSVDYRIR